MKLSQRTKLSLVQFLSMFNIININCFLKKYQMGEISQKEKLQQSIEQANDTAIENLVCEIVATRYNLHNRDMLNFNDNMQGGFDARFNDLEKCLLLDGYKINNDNTLIKIEPNIEGVTAFEDELTNELKNSNLSVKQDIINLIEKSANHFKKDDFNGCLSQARIALETLIRKIAVETFQADESILWGRALSHLTKQGFLTNDKQEEELLAAVYRFISDGAHKPLHFTDDEYARYGRNLAMSMCYYVIKKYNQPNSSGE